MKPFFIVVVLLPHYSEGDQKHIIHDEMRVDD
jgi:hypothetical protein